MVQCCPLNVVTEEDDDVKFVVSESLIKDLEFLNHFMRVLT